MSTVHDSAVCPHCGEEYEYLFDCKTWETDVITLCKCQRELWRLREGRARGTQRPRKQRRIIPQEDGRTKEGNHAA